jgi:hypothetical protein
MYDWSSYLVNDLYEGFKSSVRHVIDKWSRACFDDESMNRHWHIFKMLINRFDSLIIWSFFYVSSFDDAHLLIFSSISDWLQLVCFLFIDRFNRKWLVSLFSLLLHVSLIQWFSNQWCCCRSTYSMSSTIWIRSWRSRSYCCHRFIEFSWFSCVRMIDVSTSNQSSDVFRWLFLSW